MKSVTVLIAVLNMEHTIRECINSVLNTNYINKKIMVIDGFSTDKTYQILKEFGNKIQVFRVEGIVPIAWNFALDRINTKYVAFTDADCIVDKNWLKELLAAIDKPDIVASAGFCGTPKSVTNMQKIIGKELENRFKQFPKYIKRAPTMNLCVKTNVAKKVRFNSKMTTASEIDFGYRLTEHGKMVYNPKAKVWHNHRSTWKGFFKQQKNYAKWYMFFSMKLRNKLKGDHISSNRMIFQVPLLESVIALMFLAIFLRIIFYPSIVLLLILLIIYFTEIKKLRLSLNLYPLAFLLFFVKNFAWIFGSIQGLVYSVINKY